MISTISMASACSVAYNALPKNTPKMRLACDHLADAASFLHQLQEMTPEEALKQLRWCKENRELIRAAMALQEQARNNPAVTAVEAGQ